MERIALEDLLKKTQNLYETVAVMSKRARQITDEQKAFIEKYLESLPEMEIRESEEFEDVEIDREALEREFPKLPKPAYQAMIEMKEGKIHWEYIREFS